MKSFITKLLTYDNIGFDVDGTVYDEYDFVKQAYIGVAKTIAEYTGAEYSLVYGELCSQWKMYGSSKTTLFQDVYHVFSKKELPDTFVPDCVNAFRSQPFEIAISQEGRNVLDSLLAAGKRMFIVTDGNAELQRKKINKLGLERWFKDEDIAISGNFGSKHQKPSIYMAQVLKVDQSPKMVYLGDREVDCQFAKAIGADFIKMCNWKVKAD